MAQGWSRGQAILDKTVTRQKLADDVIAKLEEGGDNTEIVSDNVEDGHTRPGYTTTGTTLKDNFDGISDALVDEITNINDMAENWECASGVEPIVGNILVEIEPTASSRMVSAGTPFTFDVKVTASGLSKPINLEIPYHYEIIDKKDWNDFKGGTLTIKGKLEDPGDYSGLVLATGVSGGRTKRNVSNFAKINHRCFTRKKGERNNIYAARNTKG